MWRFVLALLVVVMVGSMTLGQVIDQIAQRQLEDKLSEEQQFLLSQVQLIQQALHAGLTAEQVSTWLAKASEHAVMHYELQSLTDYPLPQALMEQISAQQVVFLESTQGLTAYARLSNQQVLLVTRTHAAVTLSSDDRWLLTIGFYSILLMLLLLFLAPFLVRLATLRTAAIAFGAGKLATRVTVGSFWYLKDIELAFNQMAERLGRLIQDNQLLAGGLSHELRTPLARVRLGLDTLCDTPDPQLRAQYEVRVNQNLDEMEALINALLQFARLQHALDHRVKSRVDLQQLAKQQQEKANDPRLELMIAPGDHSIWANAQDVELILSNLLANALTHCQHKVQLQLSASRENLILSVSDDGAGIAPDDVDKVFQPFVRLASATAGQKQGFGMGLALVERVTQWLGGKVKVERCPRLKGARFLLTLPRGLK